MTEIYKYFDYIWSNTKTRDGFLVLALISILPTLTILNQTELGWLEKSLSTVGIVIMFWIIWLFHSGRKAFSSNKIIVAFSLKSLSPKDERVISVMKAQVKEKLKHLGILDDFEFRQIGSDVVTTIEQANDFINNRKYNMLIHGTVFSGNADGKYIYNLNNFMFTYRIFNPPAEAGQISAMQHDIDLFASHRDWVIEQSNEIIDTQKAGENLVEIILSIISICLARSIENTPMSVKLIESLLPELDRKAIEKGFKVQFDSTQKQISMPVDLLRSGRLRGILGNICLMQARILTEEEKYKEAINYAEKGMKAGANPFDSHATLAIPKYYLNRIPESKKHIVAMGKLQPDHPVYIVDNAFFAILENQYSEALRMYKKLPNRIKRNDQIVFQVVTFLLVRYKENPKEHSYLFATAFLNYFFADKKRGRKDLNKFKRVVKGNTEYRAMIQEANRLTK